MSNDQDLKAAIDNSPLSDEDKQHWHELLPKLNSDQRERLYHNLISKTQVYKAIKLIEKALDIIAQAEKEAEKEVKKEEEEKSDKQKLLQELEDIQKKEDEILMDEESLKQKQQETKAEIQKIREELRNLSVEIHGQPPPSYQQPHELPSAD